MRSRPAPLTFRLELDDEFRATIPSSSPIRFVRQPRARSSPTAKSRCDSLISAGWLSFDWWLLDPESPENLDEYRLALNEVVREATELAFERCKGTPDLPVKLKSSFLARMHRRAKMLQNVIVRSDAAARTCWPAHLGLGVWWLVSKLQASKDQRQAASGLRHLDAVVQDQRSPVLARGLAHYFAARTCCVIQNYARAEGEYRMAIEDGLPSNPMAMQRAYCLMRMGQLREAEAVLGAIRGEEAVRLRERVKRLRPRGAELKIRAMERMRKRGRVMREEPGRVVNRHEDAERYFTEEAERRRANQRAEIRRQTVEREQMGRIAALAAQQRRLRSEESGNVQTDIVDLVHRLWRTQQANKRAAAKKQAAEDDRLDDDEEVCAICLEGLSKAPVRKLSCSHVFHDGCIRRWVQRQKTCPYCRQAFAPALREEPAALFG